MGVVELSFSWPKGTSQITEKLCEILRHASKEEDARLSCSIRGTMCASWPKGASKPRKNYVKISDTHRKKMQVLDSLLDAGKDICIDLREQLSYPSLGQQGLAKSRKNYAKVSDTQREMKMIDPLALPIRGKKSALILVHAAFLPLVPRSFV